jgi:DNA-directed RNA polymerase
MIYPPMPWKCSEIGSYYLRKTNFSKVYSQNREARKAYDKCDVSRVMKTLDYQSNIPWRINKKVLDIVEYIWANGGGVAEIPLRFNKKVVSNEEIKGKSFKEKIELLKESQINRESHSIRCDFNIKLQIAKDFSKIKEFYFPHNIDYRGRTYPVSPHLNHIGNDFCRGLLEYSEAKPLGKNGLKWLKVHLANVIGKDKLPIQKRAEYIDTIVDTVHKCAKNPYTNTEWQQSENPWQAIATMIELSNALNVS